MASKGKRPPLHEAIRALRQFTSKRAQPEKLWEAIIAVANNPETADSTAALVLGAALEQSLEIALSTHFVLDADSCLLMFHNDQEMAPIPTPYAKFQIGYALGIYEKHVRDELKLITAIRNAFAHAKVETQFSDDPILSACDLLWVPTQWFPRDMAAPEKPKTTGEFWPLLGKRAPKQKFITSVKFLFLYLADQREGQRPKIFANNPLYYPISLQDKRPRPVPS